MSAELIGILSVGAALGGLVLALQARNDKRLGALERRMDSFTAELRALGNRVDGLEQRVARLEGLIEGLFRPSDAAEPAGDLRRPTGCAAAQQGECREGGLRILGVVPLGQPTGPWCIVSGVGDDDP